MESLKTRIANFESTHASLPADDEDFAAARLSFESKLVALRKELTAMKPIGARVDAAKAALSRA